MSSSPLKTALVLRSMTLEQLGAHVSVPMERLRLLHDVPFNAYGDGYAATDEEAGEIGAALDWPAEFFQPESYDALDVEIHGHDMDEAHMMCRCGAQALYLCDAPDPDGDMGVCSIGLCKTCALEVGEVEVHLCPAHAHLASEFTPY